MTEFVLLILEIIGTISFAVSGALVAIRARLDIFGVVFIGSITAIGGGIMRDLLIGKIPPSIFLNLPIFIIAVFAAIVVFIFSYIHRHKFEVLREKIEYINNFFDAVGLAAFSVMGTEVSFIEGFSGNIFLSVVLGMLTGIGGGIFRDILTDTTPYVFKKHVYALASIMGSCLYYVLRLCCKGVVLPSVIAIVFVVTMRMLAAKYRWSLPKIKFPELENMQKQ